MWAYTNNISLLAQTDTSTVWNTGIGAFASVLLIGVGIVIVLIALMKAAGSVLNGNIGAGVKIVLGSAVIAAFCFRPSLIGMLIDLLVLTGQKVLESIGSLGG